MTSHVAHTTMLLAVLLALSACGGGGGGSASSPAPKTYSVGVTVTGLQGTGLVLHNGSDTVTVGSTGSATFTTALATGAAYSVTVATQPSSPTQSCTVTSGQGTVASSNVMVSVACTAAYTISASVTGLKGSGLVLHNGSDSLSVTANGTVTFATALATGATYNVTVATAPSNPTENCSAAAGQGTVASSNVTVSVSCIPPPTLSIAEYSLPTAYSDLVLGNDGNLWVLSTVSSTLPSPSILNHVALDGTYQSFPLTGTSVQPSSQLFAGPSSDLWFQSQTVTAHVNIVATANNAIGNTSVLFQDRAYLRLIDAAGAWYTDTGGFQHVTTADTLLTSTPYTHDIAGTALGRDGNVWFTSQSGNLVGYITPSSPVGVITTFALPSAGSLPGAIALGADGNMWFIEGTQDALRIGTVTPAGAITEYTVTNAIGYVLGPSIALGADGNMWFSVLDSEVGNITPSGTITISTTPTAHSWPQSLIAGPDGNQWFVEPNNLAPSGKIGAISHLSITAPTNDNFASAATLANSNSPGFLFTNNFTATAEVGEPSNAGYAPTRTLWWQWTAPASGNLTIGTHGSTCLTAIGIYTGTSLASLTAVTTVANPTGNGLTSVTTAVQQGVTYDIVVDGINNTKGLVLLDWRLQ